MKSGNGSKELTRLLTAYLTSIVFGVAFLAASIAGVDGLTALWRSSVAGACALIAGHLLAPPVVDVVLTTLARERAQQLAEQPPEEDA
jgi:uncharacterized membrane protein YagU involved in acid resistance